VNLLRPNGAMVIVGALASLPGLHGAALAMRNRTVAGSLIGGLRETQGMVDLCGDHAIHPEVEIIRPDDINSAWERMKKGDVRYRFVIAMEGVREDA
jgi:uncharacterized zinc-type alcohol dehydrogenase-like protein